MSKFLKLVCIWLCLIFVALKPFILAVPLEYIDDHEQLSYDMDTEQSKAKYDPRLLSEQLLSEAATDSERIPSEWKYEEDTQQQQQQEQQGRQQSASDDWQPRERAASCHSGGLKYTHGQKVPRMDPCEVCLCVDGEIFCWWKKCVNYPGAARKKSKPETFRKKFAKFSVTPITPTTGGASVTKHHRLKSQPIQEKLRAANYGEGQKQQQQQRQQQQQQQQPQHTLMKHLKRQGAKMHRNRLPKPQQQQPLLPLHLQSQSETKKQRVQNEYRLKKQQQQTPHSANKILNFPENLPALLYYDYKTEEHRHQQHQQHQHRQQQQQQLLKHQQQQRWRQEQRQQQQSNEAQQRDHEQRESGPSLPSIAEEAAAAPAVTSKAHAMPIASKSEQEQREREEEEEEGGGKKTEETAAVTDSDILPEPPTKRPKMTTAGKAEMAATTTTTTTTPTATTATTATTIIKAKEIVKNGSVLKDLQSQDELEIKRKEEADGEQKQQQQQQQQQQQEEMEPQWQETSTTKLKSFAVDNYFLRNSKSDGNNDNRTNNNNNNNNNNNRHHVQPNYKTTTITTDSSNNNNNVEPQRNNIEEAHSTIDSRFSNVTQQDKCGDNSNENIDDDNNNNNDDSVYEDDEEEEQAEQQDQDDNGDVDTELNTAEGEDEDFHRWLSFMGHHSEENSKKKKKNNNNSGSNDCSEIDCNSKQTAFRAAAAAAPAEAINPYATTMNAANLMTATTTNNHINRQAVADTYPTHTHSERRGGDSVRANKMAAGDAGSFWRGSYNDSSREFNGSAVSVDILSTAGQQEQSERQQQKEQQEQKQQRKQLVQQRLFVLPAALISNASRAAEIAAAAAAASIKGAGSNTNRNNSSAATTLTPRATMAATTTTGTAATTSYINSGNSAISQISSAQSTSTAPSHESVTMATDKQCNVMGTLYKIGDVLPQETGNCLQCVCIDGGSTKDDTPRVTCSPHNCPPLVLPDLFDATGY